MDELVERVLACANRISPKPLDLGPDGDLALEAFHFDSLSVFAFMVELENEFGVSIDEALMNQEELGSIRSTAAFIAGQQKAAGHASGA